MKNILVIDDERYFDASIPQSYDVTYVTTKHQAKNELVCGLYFDEVWFDHDLGDDGDIKPLITWIDEMNQYDLTYLHNIATCFIHTMNPVGREYIASTLRKYYPVHIVDPADCGLGVW